MEPLFGGKFWYSRPECSCEGAARQQEAQAAAERQRARMAAEHRRTCRLRGRLAEMTLDNLRLLPGIGEALETARRMVEQWPNGRFHDGRRGLVLFGSFGCGKTHLAAGIGNAPVDRGVRADDGGSGCAPQ